MKEILKYLRTINSYSQQTVASAIGLSRQSYNKYEAGTVTPSDAVIKKLAAFYKVQEEFIRAGKVPQVPGKKNAVYKISHQSEPVLEIADSYSAAFAAETPVKTEEINSSPLDKSVTNKAANTFLKIQIKF